MIHSRFILSARDQSGAGVSRGVAAARGNGPGLQNTDRGKDGFGLMLNSMQDKESGKNSASASRERMNPSSGGPGADHHRFVKHASEEEVAGEEKSGSGMTAAFARSSGGSEGESEVKPRDSREAAGLKIPRSPDPDSGELSANDPGDEIEGPTGRRRGDSRPVENGMGARFERGQAKQNMEAAQSEAGADVSKGGESGSGNDSGSGSDSVKGSLPADGIWPEIGRHPAGDSGGRAAEISDGRTQPGQPGERRSPAGNKPSAGRGKGVIPAFRGSGNSDKAAAGEAAGSDDSGRNRAGAVLKGADIQKTDGIREAGNEKADRADDSSAGSNRFQSAERRGAAGLAESLNQGRGLRDPREEFRELSRGKPGSGRFGNRADAALITGSRDPESRKAGTAGFGELRDSNASNASSELFRSLKQNLDEQIRLRRLAESGGMAAGAVKESKQVQVKNSREQRQKNYPSTPSAGDGLQVERSALYVDRLEAPGKPEAAGGGGAVGSGGFQKFFSGGVGGDAPAASDNPATEANTDWKEIVMEAIESERSRSGESAGSGLNRLALIPVPNISIRQHILPGLTRQVAESAKGGKSSNAGWQKHHVILDDGKNIQLSSRRVDGLLQVKISSANTELNRLLIQHQNEIREHLEKECDLQVDLQFGDLQGQDLSGYPGETFPGSGKGRGRHGSGGRKTIPERVEEVVPKSVRKFGYNRMEWTV